MTEHSLDLSQIRAQFPALHQTDEAGRPYVFFDGPGGTQVPQAVIDAMADYLIRANANKGGHFLTSRRSDEVLHDAHAAMADFLNASTPSEIVFGANMTTLTYAVSRSIGRALQPGDEVVVTRLEHDANIAPWLALEELGVNVKWADFDVEDCRLDIEHLASLLTKKTKLVAVGYASNAVGTINPVSRIAALVRNVGAWLWVDAVHFAPHGPIDVQTLGCDFLVCSAYKFFGPHLGVLWGRLDLLEQLHAYQVRTADPNPPYKFETGTLNQEGMAGTTAAIDYLADLGRQYGNLFAAKLSNYEGRRKDLKQAMHAIRAYERDLVTYLIAELDDIKGIKVHGITPPAEFDERCPTVAFTHETLSPSHIANHLGERGIFVWDGNYYALSVTERLGVEETGGMVRIGLVHYNTRQEIDRLLAALKEL